jgi:hypothetical protein
LDLSGLGPIVVGVDPADASSAHVAAACALAAGLHTSVEVVHVVPALAVLDRWRAHADAAMRERMDWARREVERRVHAVGPGVPVHVRIETGAVPERLADAALSGADRAPLIVLGRNAPGSRAGAPGTIAYRVLSITKAPVLVYAG